MIDQLRIIPLDTDGRSVTFNLKEAADKINEIIVAVNKLTTIAETTGAITREGS